MTSKVQQTGQCRATDEGFPAESRECDIICSLSTMCVLVLDSGCKTTDDRVLLLQTLRRLGGTDFKHIADKLEKELEEKLELLLKRYSEDFVKDVLGDESFARASHLRTERLEAEKKLSAYRRGSALEPTKVEFEKRSDGTFPLAALVAGVAWPEGVIPDKREMYLSDEEFASVFKMTKDAWKGVDKVMRARLKKEHKLW